MKRLNIIFAIVMTLLVIAVSFLGGTGFAHGVSDFIAYSPRVPIVRKVSIGSGCVIVAIAFVYGAISRLRSVKVVVVMSDETALVFFLVMLIHVPFLCWSLASITHCDFWQFQSSACFLALVVGSLVAVRTKRYRYILYYAILFLLLGGIIPPA